MSEEKQDQSKVFIAYFVEGYEVQTESLDVSHQEAYNEEFKGRIPLRDDYEYWKQRNGIEKGVENPQIGFRFTDNTRKKIYEYLNKKPISECGDLIYEIFERNPEGYITEEGVKTLMDYLRENCPREEVKPILEDVANGGLLQYTFDQGAEAQAN